MLAAKDNQNSAAEFQKRAGASTVKNFERNASGKDSVLDREAATTY